MLITRPQKYKKSSNKPTRMRGAIILPSVRSRSGCRSPAKDTPRTDPSVMFWSRKHIQLGNSASMSFGHLRSGPSTVSCVPLRGTCLRRTPTHYSSPWADGSLAVCVSRFFGNNVLNCGIALGVYCWLAGLPQIHFGREDGVERTL